MLAMLLVVDGEVAGVFLTVATISLAMFALSRKIG